MLIPMISSLKKNRRFRRYLLMSLPLFISILFASGARAGDLPPRIPLDLKKVSRQALPQSVQDVYRGPDGRVWFEIDRPGVNLSLETAKKVVEREFSKEHPQIPGLQILGWGRNHRIWLFRGSLRGYGSDTILGYDGTNWVQTESQIRLYPGLVPIVLKEHTLFAGDAGVLGFNGNRFRTLRQVRGKGPLARITPEPGRESAVIYFRYRHPLHRFDDGKLLKLSFSKKLPYRLPGLAACRFGVFAHVGDSLQKIADARAAWPDQSKKEFRNEIDHLLKQYADGNRAKKQKIISILKKGGKQAITHLKKSLKEISDPTRRLHVKLVILLLERKRDGSRKQSGKSDTDSGAGDFGSYRVQTVSMLHQLPTGHVLVGVKSGQDVSTGRDLDPGLLVVPPYAEPNYIPVDDETLLTPRNGRHHVLRKTRPRRIGDGLYWIPNGRFSNLVFDLKNSSVSTIKSPKIRAMDREGRRYFTTSHNSGRRMTSRMRSKLKKYYKKHPKLDESDLKQRPDSSPNIVARFPGQPDHRITPDNPLPLDTYQADGRTKNTPVVRTDPQGRLYAVQKNGGLMRYGGTSWEPIENAGNVRAADPVLIGNNGTILLRSKETWKLIRDGQVHRAQSAKTLIEQHYETVAYQFIGGSAVGPYPPRSRLIADELGNIWHRNGSRLHVFSLGVWKNLSRENEQYLEPVGNGKWIYMSEQGTDRNRASFLRMQKDLEQRNAPFSPSRTEALPPVKTRTGELWIARAAEDDGSKPAATGIKNPDQIQTVEGHGLPHTSDGAGNVVLYKRPTDDNPGTISFVRDGSVKHQVSLKEMQEPTTIASNRPGSVYVASGDRMVHLTAEQPSEKPEAYDVTETFEIAEKFSSYRVQKLYGGSHNDLGLVLKNGNKYVLEVIKTKTSGF